MNKVLALIKKKYCENLRIKNPSEILAISFQLVSKNSKGNSVFLIQHPGKEAFYWELEKVDLSGFSRMQSLAIPKQYRKDFDVTSNKAMIANWLNRHTGHNILEEDIAYLVPEKNYINVVIAADSMRFKFTSLQLIRL